MLLLPFVSSSSSLILLQLVGGEFDLEMNFIIQEAESIGCMVELLSHCEVTCQAEIWSMFTAILRKSVRNLQTSTEVGLIQQVLLKMSTVDDMIAGNCAFMGMWRYTYKTLKAPWHKNMLKSVSQYFSSIDNTVYTGIWQMCTPRKISTTTKTSTSYFLIRISLESFIWTAGERITQSDHNITTGQL